jgi:hypothetical protein
MLYFLLDESVHDLAFCPSKAYITGGGHGSGSEVAPA